MRFLRAWVLAAALLAGLHAGAQESAPAPRAAASGSAAAAQPPGSAQSAAASAQSAAASARAPVSVFYLFSDGQMPVTLNAYKKLLAEHPELEGKVDLGFVTESVIDDVDAEKVERADVLVFDTMNQKLVDEFDEKHHVDLLDRIADHGRVIAVGVGLQPKEHYVEKGVVWDDRARALWEHSGERNQLGLLEYALTEAGVEGLKVPDPEPSLDFGYYYPDPSGKGGHAFATWDEFDAWRAAHGKKHPGAPRVALSFFKANYYTSDMEVIDALVAEIERRGAEAIPFFGYPGGVASERMLIDGDGKPRADVALSLLFRFADFETAKSLEKLNIPVINLVTLYGRSEKDWRESATGLSMFEGTFQVAVPELAGLVSPVVVGSREKILDLQTGLSVVRSRPIEERIGVAVGRGLRYAALGRTPNADKRVALMYYNFPPGKAGISASYLNVAESLSNVLKRLKEEGYTIGDADLSADAVLARITKARNVGGYAPGELEEMLAEGENERIPLDEYERWLDALAPALKAKIVKDWGPAEDVKVMADRSGPTPQLVVPLVRYGNVLLMPQPARGWGEDHEQLYHAENLAPPHQYVAVYEWLRNTFHADALVHVGTHGTLEWLDGKDVGQTSEDPSDALLGDLPDIYIYNVDVVGEGLVARRRGLATLVDHMVPPFKRGGLNADLASLEESMSDYDANLKKNPELAAANAGEIRAKVQSLGIAKDLGIDVSDTGNLDEETLHRIEEHVLEIKGQNIPYGLHSFG
ncbi:MAG TPA: cobaltochelatase subunit CobN, partial [Gammaproteobacteria bacterium]|nr:cobaltochelatase subunit CobN [Gammaproteobacteria bacterium]